MGLPLPDDASAGPELAAEYAAAREREGRVMAILRALGPRAEVVRAFLELADAVLYGPAALGRRERELLALATSEANGADYSAGVHATLLSELGDAGEHDEALRTFARRLTLAPAEAEDAVAALRAHLSDAEVYDAVAVVGLLNLGEPVGAGDGDRGEGRPAVARHRWYHSLHVRLGPRPRQRGRIPCPNRLIPPR